MLVTWENVPEYIYINYENNMTRRREIPDDSEWLWCDVRGVKGEP